MEPQRAARRDDRAGERSDAGPVSSPRPDARATTRGDRVQVRRLIQAAERSSPPMAAGHSDRIQRSPFGAVTAGLRNAVRGLSGKQQTAGTTKTAATKLPAATPEKRSVRFHHSADDDVRGKDQRYEPTLSVDKAYAGEDLELQGDMRNNVETALAGLVSGDPTAEQTARSALAWVNWSQDDIDEALARRRGGKASAVKYLDHDQRAQYQVHGGSSMTYGVTGDAFDTSQMETNVGGKGFGIYVLDEYGRIFAASHKQGLFHHSSFLAGQKAACAGEIKVTGGRLQHLTNKTGHYKASAAELEKMIDALRSRGVAVDGVPLTVYGREGKEVTTIDTFLEQRAMTAPFSSPVAESPSGLRPGSRRR